MARKVSTQTQRKARQEQASPFWHQATLGHLDRGYKSGFPYLRVLRARTGSHYLSCPAFATSEATYPTTNPGFKTVLLESCTMLCSAQVVRNNWFQVQAPTLEAVTALGCFWSQGEAGTEPRLWTEMEG